MENRKNSTIKFENVEKVEESEFITESQVDITKFPIEFNTKRPIIISENNKGNSTPKIIDVKVPKTK